MMSPMKFANEFLKEATRLKKEKKYLEAIKMLDKAYEVGTQAIPRQTRITLTK